MNLAACDMKMNIKLTIFGVMLWVASSLALAGGSKPPEADATTPTPAAVSTPAQKPAAPDYEAGSAAYDAGDYDKARHIWLPLAEKGDVRAQRGMGKLYEKGRGVERDFAMAFKWYRPAAEKGDAESQYRLSVGYGYGLGGIKKDEAKAMEWLRKAAENGQKRAQRSLAKGYEDGLNGLPRDPEKAKYWYDRSKTRE
jgi:TPR repeat protein